MNFSRFCLSAFLIFSAFTVSFGQVKSATESKTEKTEAQLELEKKALKLTEQAVGEAATLKLWENRSLAFAMAGDLLWDSNQKRAKALFRDAADELVQGAIQPKEKAKDYYEDFYYWQDRSPRRVILLMIASHDADMALKFLQETRPADLQKAIDDSKRPSVKGQKKSPAEMQKESGDKFKAEQEVSLEQQFAAKAAEQDPKKAAKLIRESLKKGVSMSAVTLIQKVNEKDEELGKELFKEVLSKILTTKFDGDNDGRTERQIAAYLLNQSVNPKVFESRNEKFVKLKIEEADLKDIADKLADFYLASKGYNEFWGFNELLPAFKKYAPAKIDALKQKEKAILDNTPEQMRTYIEGSKKASDPNSTPEELMEDAKNQTSWQKYNNYKLAVDKFLEKGDGEKARNSLKSEPDSKQKTDALEYLSSKQSEKAIKDGKMEEAQSLIESAETENSKISLMVDIALGFEKKNTEEDHKTAVKLIEDASRLVNNVPESVEEGDNILKVVSGYALIEPKSAFEYLNNMIYMANDLMTAQALLAKYNKRSNNFRDGEIIYTQIFNNSYAKYSKALAKLSEHDFGKTESLISQFQRQDIQIFAKMLVAQSILKEKIGLEGNNQYGVYYSF